MNTFEVPQGQFILNRYPLQKNDQLRAWDAADEYLLLQLQQQELLNNSLHLLILNDAFGALTVPLAGYRPRTVTDSYVSQQAIVENLRNNTIPADSITLSNSLQPLTGIYDLVLVKLPKNLSMLEYQLYQLRDCCDKNTVILAAAMTKHIHTSTIKLFEKIIGATTTSLARKKARLVMSEFDAAVEPGESPYPGEYTVDITGDTLVNHANVFSRERLDIGSRFMLAHIPQSDRYKDILDLACGNGILGITAARLNPQAHVWFVDESYMAVASAKMNVQGLLVENSMDNVSRFDFRVTDCLQGIDNDSIDLILNNPPFHQHHVVGDFIAWQMFKESRKKLRQSGELVVVANRHLGYHVKLKRLFGNCETVASNRKFVILKAVNR